MIMKSVVSQEWVKEDRAGVEAKKAQEAICKFLNARFGDIARNLQGRVKRIGNLDHQECSMTASSAIGKCRTFLVTKIKEFVTATAAMRVSEILRVIPFIW